MTPLNSWLTNTLRPYFGLHPIEEHWGTIEIRDDYYICVDGDIIKKRIFVNEQAYQEADVEIPTRNCEVILPQTARGKEKKMNYTNISSVKANGVVFSAGVRTEDPPSSHINARNMKTYFSLPLTNMKNLTSKEEIVEWLHQYPSNLPPDYDLQLEKLTRKKSLRYKAVPGDIFRVEIDLFTDGFVLVIGDLRQMQKDGLFSKDSLWNDVMTMPLFIRPYLFKTTNRCPSIEDITSVQLSEQTLIVMDDLFMRGGYEKVGHKTLTETDILLPLGYGINIDNGKEERYRLSWGTGTISKSEQETSFKTGSRFSNYGVQAGIDVKCFDTFSRSRSLDNPLYTKEHKQALAEFGFPKDITYDEFNRQTGGLTRLEYLDYLSKKYARTRK
ncbi:immunity 26/phosphotriesterase HocA family protein [Lysinibacillus sp. G4S2]|uniref:immunity 26/phosphotriesterase HocA family protein n=1 Tax=Lysinibacillus sp. G4S2 TaxID=3055859 RepID=UPI0025A2C3AF|nr:immunity 26/phosphotriesterase HocA family protein [Lysinibacillus sp. G4S2]MDM5248683.1 immunity 26/phosphotriesterase HocA family protein [Lysinibacillus sp. G4S2]